MPAVPLFDLAPGLTVSRLCLGTMTFGEQNTLQQSFRLLDEAFHGGVNFVDTAEMYPVPQRRATQGRSEEYIGRWMKEHKVPRDRVVLATKITGPSGQMTWIRGGPKCLDGKNILEAIDNSLLRLRTDYIDLQQIHWPDRYVPMFGEIEYNSNRQITSVPIEDQLDALGRAVDDGKIRYVGLSNETPYGLMKFLQIAKDGRYPRIVSVQNSYNLLCRTFDSGLAECCHHERISLLAYSPTAMGILSGKYFFPGGGPPDARMNLYRGKYSEGESRYNLSNVTINAAAREYINIALEYSIPPAVLAIAFVLMHPLVASAIFGVTKLSQLKEVLEACRVHVTPEITAEINKVHAKWAARVLVNSHEACKHGRKEVGLPSHFAAFSKTTKETLKTTRKRQHSVLDMIRPSSKLSNQDVQTEIQVIDATDDAASTLCSIALPSTVLENSKQQNDWMGPMLKLSLPNFSGKTVDNPHLLKYSCHMNCRVRTVEPAIVSGPICDKREERYGDEKTSEASTEPREREMSISVLLSKPILALEFSCLKMHVEAPTILSSHRGRIN